MPKISIICSIYKRPDFLEKKLLSLTNQSCDDFELVMADDGSGPDVAEVIREWSPRLRFPIQHVRHEDQGFRKARIVNQAVKEARADYLVFTDHDCICHHRYIERHLVHARPQRVLCGRRVLLTDEGTRGLSRDDILSRRIEKLSYLKPRCDKKSLQYARYNPFMTLIRQKKASKIWFFGCNFSLYKRDFEKLNGFDERIHFPGEDTNLFRRLRLTDLKLKYIAYEAILYHLAHGRGYPAGTRDIDREVAWPSSSWTTHGMVKAGM